ncbi:MAG: flagellar brake protein [Bacillota bacterium]
MGENGLLETVFAPGSSIMIEYVNLRGLPKNCSTRVEDLEESYLILRAPYVKGHPERFHESQELTLRRLDSEQKEAYVTSVFVIDVRQGETPMLVCSKPKKINKTSLRRFSRFSVNMPFSYIFPNQSKEHSGTIRDLSLGGCYALINPAPGLKEGAAMQLLITIPGDGKALSLKGRVLRIDNLSEGDKGPVGIAVDYYLLTDEMLEKLYGYIFQLQLTHERLSGPVPDVNDQ